MNKLTKREIIKNIAIVFLVIMLILTFFSNTIMNRTLPEVSTQQVTRGTVSLQVRGEGVVEAEDPYNVVIDETRKVKGVLVHEGDHVDVGDVLYTLEGESGEELTTARNELETAKNTYELSVLDSGLTSYEISQVEAGVSANTGSILSVLEGKDKEIEDAQKKVNDYTNKIDDLTRQISLTENGTPAVTDEEKAYNSAKSDFEKAEAALNELKGLIDDYENARGEYEIKEALYVKTKQDYEDEYNSATRDNDLCQALYDKMIDAEAEKQRAKNVLDAANMKYPSADALNKAQAEYNAKKKAMEDAETNFNNKKNSNANQSSSLYQQKIQLEKEKADAERKVTELTEARTKYFNAERKKIEMEKSYQDVLDKEKKVKELEDKALGGQIVAPVAGNITTMGYTAGEKIEAGSTVTVIQIDGKGYKVTFPVTSKQAKSVKVGDEVSVVNAWYYGDVNVNLVAIQPDKNNTRDGKILVFSVNGSGVNPGQSITLSVGQKSSEYDNIVPLSALQNDNTGDFILIMETKSTPFGSRYIAKRVDVEILAKDDRVAAVSGDLTGWEYVITNASKYIESGDQVNLSEN